ncbi:MAG: hypothetical protein R3352_04575 [Salinisphaeraceae bacterium]|nr:hypothetical protein [Salinisphaeraceae bacterium]
MLSKSPTEAERKTLGLAYILYGLNIFMPPLPSIIGVLINHLRVHEVQSDFARNHHRWLMRTFWFMLLWGVIGGVLTGIGVGFVILGIAYLWYIYRIVRGGLNYLESRAELPLPE